MSKCDNCWDGSVGDFYLFGGCAAWPEVRRQTLCYHHARRSRPLSGILLVRDHTVAGKMREYWNYMTREYIDGCKLRAQKQQLPATYSQEMLAGYEHMQGLLAPIEQKIVLAAFEYKAVAEARVRELEEQFRERDNAEGAAPGAADPALSSERHEIAAAPG
jgi:hypothetical protein